MFYYWLEPTSIVFYVVSLELAIWQVVFMVALCGLFMLQLVSVIEFLLTDFLYDKVPNKEITLLGTPTALLFLLTSVGVIYIYCNNN